jgi:hypothetical protein
MAICCRPQAHGIVSTKGEENILNRLFHVKGATPLQLGNHGGMAQVRELEA